MRTNAVKCKQLPDTQVPLTKLSACSLVISLEGAETSPLGITGVYFPPKSAIKLTHRDLITGEGTFRAINEQKIGRIIRGDFNTTRRIKDFDEWLGMIGA